MTVAPSFRPTVNGSSESEVLKERFETSLSVYYFLLLITAKLQLL